MLQFKTTQDYHNLSCIKLYFHLYFFTVIENNEILYRDYVDISVAVATPKVCNSSRGNIFFANVDN